MKNIIICLIFLLLAIKLNAQSKYVPGYIITLENDTIHGKINNKRDYKNSIECVFKDKNGTTTKYLPDQIIAYRFDNGKYYISKKIHINGLPQTLFLEFLLKGIAKLYYYGNINGQHYIIEKNNELIELIKEETTINPNQFGYSTTYNKKYIGVLKAIFKDTPELSEEINNAILNHKSLIKLAKNYHQYACTDNSECIIYEKTVSRNKFEFAPNISINSPSINYIHYDYDVTANSNSSIALGLDIRTMLHRSNQKLSIQLQTLAGKYKLNGISQRRVGITTTTLELNNEQFYLKNRLSLNYTPFNNFSPIFQIGFWNKFLFSSDITTILTTSDSPVEVYNSLPIYEKKIDAGLSMGVGVSLGKKVFLLANYDIGSYLHEYTRIKTNTLSFKAGIYL